MSAFAVIDDRLDVCDIADTMSSKTRTPDEPPSRLYTALIELMPAGLSENAWAMLAKVNRNVFGDIRRRGNAKHDTLEKLLSAIGKGFGDLDPSLRPVRSEVRAAPLREVESDRDPFAHPELGVPRLGSGEGGSYDDIDQSIELTELRLGEVLEWLEREPALKNDPRAYALTILGHSMSPVLDQGATVKVSPRASVSVGDLVVVQLRGAEGDDERVQMVLIKRLVRRSGSFIELQQFNPPAIFQVPASRVAIDNEWRAAIHKVVSVHF